MPTRFHLTIMILCEFLGFLVAAIFVGAAWVNGWFGSHLWAVALVLLGGVLIGVGLPRLVFRKLLPARCGQDDCGGSAFPTGQNPIVYVCRRCGQCAVTHVFEDQVPRHGEDTE